jgi:hypothetical protein
MQTFGQSSIYCGSDDTAPTKPRTGLFLEPSVFSSLFPVSALGFSLPVRHGGDCRRSLVGLQQRSGLCPLLGQKQTSRHVRVMSVIPLKADIRQRVEHVCYLERFGRINRSAWKMLTAEEWAQVDNHVTTCDFPETAAGWLDLGRKSAAREISQFRARGPNGRGRISLTQDPAVSLQYAGELIAAFIEHGGAPERMGPGDKRSIGAGPAHCAVSGHRCPCVLEQPSPPVTRGRPLPSMPQP